MRLARDVQQLLLPAAFPAGSDVDIAATCVPAWDVGGDYYDVFRDPGGNVVLVVADVAGKGVAAGLLTALVHGAVHASSHSVGEPAQLMHDINDLLYGRSADNRYATMCWARLDPRERASATAGRAPGHEWSESIAARGRRSRRRPAAQRSLRQRLPAAATGGRAGHVLRRAHRGRKRSG
jgi:phosphoserine phosphatase RsbU/P